MAIDPHKRQKKLARRKAKLKQNKKAQAGGHQHDTLARIQRSADAPIMHCLTTAELWEQGIANILISRRLANDKVAFTTFLLDTYCLGVKDVSFAVLPEARYQAQIHEHLTEDRDVIHLDPNSARKLIEGAVEYANKIGLSPHRDYAKGMLIFGDLDATSSSEQFAYGKNGKPFFIAGPYDSPSRCAKILDTLTERCGPEGFRYLLPASCSGTEPQGGHFSQDELRAMEESGEWEIVEEESY